MAAKDLDGLAKSGQMDFGEVGILAVQFDISMMKDGRDDQVIIINGKKMWGDVTQSWHQA